MAAKAYSRDRAESTARPPKRRGALRRWLGFLSALRGDERGVSAIEFALATPVLLALIVPVIDLGLVFSEQMKVQQAAQAGGQYASLHGYDATRISSAVTGATLLSVSASPAPTQQCGCVSGSTVTLSGAPPCLTTCANGLTPGTYVSVSAQASYTPITPYSSYLNAIPTTLTAQSIVRVQ
jgi:Flp pilus assembly protein TadG